MEQERIAGQKELDAALVRLTRLHEEMTKEKPPRCNVGRSPAVARKKRTIPFRPSTRHARGVGAKWDSVPASDNRQKRSHGHVDRSGREFCKKFESFQPFGLMGHATSWSHNPSSGVRYIGARYGLRGVRVGEASMTGPD